jgi:hypothetical protein
MPHFVRTNAVFQVTATRYPFENVLDLVNRHSMRSPHRHEQGSIIVASFMEITLQPDARLCPEVNLTLLVAFAKNVYSAPLPIDVVSIQPLNLGYTTSAREEELNQCVFQCIPAGIAK